MEYYSAIKRNELATPERAWRNLQCTLLSGRSYLKRLCPIGFQLHDVPEKTKLDSMASSAVARGWAGGVTNTGDTGDF